MSIENIEHFSGIFKAAFERKQLRRPSYSLGALARDLGVSKPYVSRIFSGKQLPSPKFLREITSLLAFTEEEKATMYLSICFESLPTLECQKYFLRELCPRKLLDKENGFTLLADESFAILARWEAMAILQLIAVKDFTADLKWIAKRLNTCEMNVAEAVALLFHHGLIKEVEGSWVKKHRRVSFASKASNATFTKYQKQMVERQLLELDEEMTDKRQILSLTVASSHEKLEEVKKLLEETLAKSFDLLKTEQASEVYQLNIGLIPLTK